MNGLRCHRWVSYEFWILIKMFTMRQERNSSPQLDMAIAKSCANACWIVFGVGYCAIPFQDESSP